MSPAWALPSALGAHGRGPGTPVIWETAPRTACPQGGWPDPPFPPQGRPRGLGVKLFMAKLLVSVISENCCVGARM